MKNRICQSLLLLFVAAIGFSQQKPLFSISSNYDLDGKASFEEIKQLIVDSYYYDGITENDLNWAAIKGMLEQISPPETPSLARLWTDTEYEKILNSLKGVRVTMGFGSSFNANDGSLTVTDIIVGSSAEGKLQLQDRILRIDNEILHDKNIEQINRLLDGKIGQSSSLKVVRDINIFDVELLRETLKSENLVVAEIPGQKMALIELKKVSLGIASDLEKELAQLQPKGINSIVLDLRNNTGGVLNEGVNIAKLFMKKGDIVLRTQSRSNGVTNYATDIDKFYNLKIALLINENTASAAEIVTSALQDHNRATIIGKKTFGKGVIETTYTLKNDYRVKFITSAMYSPKGNSWQAKGLLPDYFIDQSQTVYQNVSKMMIEERLRSDLHLSTAVKLLGQ